MKISLIGGSGFIGQYLIPFLTNQNHIVEIVDIQPPSMHHYSYRHADIRKIDELSQSINNIDILINLAAVHRDDVVPKTLYREVNVEGSSNLCKVASQKGINHILFISSVAVYGLPGLSTNEKSTLRPFNEYGITKASAEKVFTSWQRESPAERILTIIRPTVVFGPGNRGNVFNLMKTLASRKFIMIGNGQNKKSMAYVENVAAFISHVIGNATPGIHIYNYTDKPDLSMNELIETINLALGKSQRTKFKIPFYVGLFAGYISDLSHTLFRIPMPISSIRVKKFCASTTFDTEVDTNGFMPVFTLKEGLSKTIEHEFLRERIGPTS
jgi:nucleoside-diphosphate-sugar epimerase